MLKEKLEKAGKAGIIPLAILALTLHFNFQYEAQKRAEQEQWLKYADVVAKMSETIPRFELRPHALIKDRIEFYNEVMRCSVKPIVSELDRCFSKWKDGPGSGVLFPKDPEYKKPREPENDPTPPWLEDGVIEYDDAG